MPKLLTKKEKVSLFILILILSTNIIGVITVFINKKDVYSNHFDSIMDNDEYFLFEIKPHNGQISDFVIKITFNVNYGNPSDSYFPYTIMMWENFNEVINKKTNLFWYEQVTYQFFQDIFSDSVIFKKTDYYSSSNSKTKINLNFTDIYLDKIPPKANENLLFLFFLRNEEESINEQIDVTFEIIYEITGKFLNISYLYLLLFIIGISLSTYFIKTSVKKIIPEKYIDSVEGIDKDIQNIINEINTSYSYQMIISIPIMMRKLIENYLINVLREHFGVDNKELFFHDRKNFPQFHSFKKLITNFCNVETIKELKIYNSSLKSKELKLKLEFFRERGNDSAHNMDTDGNSVKLWLESEKERFNELIKVLDNLNSDIRHAKQN